MHRHPRQQGVVLITGLIILVLLTILGLTASRSILLEERMAGNMKDQNVAFQAAEAALRMGESYLTGASLGTFVLDTDAAHLAKFPTGLYAATLSTTTERWEQAVWDDAGSVAYPRTPANLLVATVTPAGAAAPPRYIIEDMSTTLKCTTNSTSSCAIAPVSLKKLDEESKDETVALAGAGIFRVTARGVGTSTNTIAYVQSYYFR